MEVTPLYTILPKVHVHAIVELGICHWSHSQDYGEQQNTNSFTLFLVHFVCKSSKQNENLG